MIAPENNRRQKNETGLIGSHFTTWDASQNGLKVVELLEGCV
jgi:hypothetical protein